MCPPRSLQSYWTLVILSSPSKEGLCWPVQRDSSVIYWRNSSTPSAFTCPTRRPRASPTLGRLRMDLSLRKTKEILDAWRTEQYQSGGAGNLHHRAMRGNDVGRSRRRRRQGRKPRPRRSLPQLQRRLLQRALSSV